MSLWSKFLNESGICVSGYGGNRPCDNGCPCDNCSADWIQDAYESWKVSNGYDENMYVPYNRIGYMMGIIRRANKESVLFHPDMDVLVSYKYEYGDDKEHIIIGTRDDKKTISIDCSTKEISHSYSSADECVQSLFKVYHYSMKYLEEEECEE